MLPHRLAGACTLTGVEIMGNHAFTATLFPAFRVRIFDVSRVQLFHLYFVRVLIFLVSGSFIKDQPVGSDQFLQLIYKLLRRRK